MKCSLTLTLIALMANFAYGFSAAAAQATPSTGGAATDGGGAGTSFFRTFAAASAATTRGHHRLGLFPSTASLTAATFPRGGGGAGFGFGTMGRKISQRTKAPSTTRRQLTQRDPLIDTGSKCPVTGLAALFGSVWGVGGVLYILAKAVKRVLPIALEPFQGAAGGAIPLSQFQLGYVYSCVRNAGCHLSESMPKLTDPMPALFLNRFFSLSIAACTSSPACGSRMSKGTRVFSASFLPWSSSDPLP